jgi:hypothetical protein
VVPHVLGLLTDDAVQGKDELICDLLVPIALGDETDFVPEGVQIKDGEIVAFYDGLPDDEEAKQLASWERDAYNAVAQCVPQFVRLLDSHDNSLRMASVYALAWFPLSAQDTLPRIHEIFVTESDPFARANACVTIGLLSRYLNSRQYIPYLEKDLSTDRPEIQRVAAAIACSTILGADVPDSPLLILADQLTKGLRSLQEEADEAGLRWPLIKHVYGVLRCLGIQGAESRILSATLPRIESAQSIQAKLRLLRLLTSNVPSPMPLVADNPRTPLTTMQHMGFEALDPLKEKLVNELCANLDPRPKKTWENFEVTRGILLLLFFQQRSAGGEIASETLTPLQRRALAEMAAKGGWKTIGGLWNGNYSYLLTCYGLPNDPKSLAQFCGADRWLGKPRWWEFWRLL